MSRASRNRRGLEQHPSATGASLQMGVFCITLFNLSSSSPEHPSTLQCYSHLLPRSSRGEQGGARMRVEVELLPRRLARSFDVGHISFACERVYQPCAYQAVDAVFVDNRTCTAREKQHSECGAICGGRSAFANLILTGRPQSFGMQPSASYIPSCPCAPTVASIGHVFP